jgi:phosphoadenosine phosphosulfate reductase
MLIQSYRHTEADLELWSEYELADMLESVNPSKVDESIRCIVDFAKDGACYVGCSWGKDSVVLLDMLIRSGLKLPVVWVRMSGRDNPDCETVRDDFLSRFSIEYHERNFVYDLCQKDEHWKAIDREFGNKRITGLRADESTNRRMTIFYHGKSTARSCRPLGFWCCDEIFAWLAKNNLPVHPAYAMLGGGRWDRKYLRTHGIGGTSGTDRGRREWEKEYYGDVLSKI